jgi:hypothetical protein
MLVQLVENKNKNEGRFSGVHMTFPFIFPANPLKTRSRPFFRSIIDQRQVHNVAMIIFRARSLSLAHIFSFGFTRGEVGFKKNKKKFSKRSEPNLGKIPSPPQRLAPTGKSVFGVRTRDVVENNTQLSEPVIAECDSFNFLPQAQRAKPRPVLHEWLERR